MFGPKGHLPNVISKAQTVIILNLVRQKRLSVEYKTNKGTIKYFVSDTEDSNTDPNIQKL